MKSCLIKLFVVFSGCALLPGLLSGADDVPPPPPPPPTDSSSVMTKPVSPRTPADNSEPYTDVTPAPRPPSTKKQGPVRPGVTIIPKQFETRAEYRVNSILYMIKVTPKSRKGHTYYLVDYHGDGVFVRSDFRPKNTIPEWVLERSN